jgi:hypothetical protein
MIIIAVLLSLSWNLSETSSATHLQSQNSPPPASTHQDQQAAPIEANALDLESLFDTLQTLLQSRAGKLGMAIDPSQSKMFVIGTSPAVLTPTSIFNPATLGAVGLMETARPFSVRGKDLAAGLYRLEIGGNPITKKMALNLRDEFGNLAASLSATEVKVIPVPRTTLAGGVNAAQLPFGLQGPTIGLNVVLSSVAPFFKIVPCIGFLVPTTFAVLQVGFCL